MAFDVGKQAAAPVPETPAEPTREPIGQSSGGPVASGGAATAVRSGRGAVSRLRGLVPQLDPARGPASPLVALDARGALLRIDQAIGQLRTMTASRPELASDLAALQDARAELAPAVERSTDDAAAAWQRDAAPIAARLGLGSVDIRADDHARAVTDAKRAEGVAHGSTVFLHPDRIAPGTDTGREVLAHELVHLAQARVAGTETDQDDRDAAELEAADLAPALAAGSPVRTPTRPIDLSRPAGNVDAATAKAMVAKWLKIHSPPSDVAWKYIQTNHAKFVAAFAAEVGKIPVVEHPRLKWAGNLGTTFAEALAGFLAVSRYKALFIDIKDLLHPVDPMRIIDQNRVLDDGKPGQSKDGKDPTGPLDWIPECGTALALEVMKAAQRSFARLLPRFLIQIDEQHPNPPTLADLVTSHPMDDVIARILVDQRVVGQVGKPAACKTKDNSPQAFRYGARFLQNFRWMGETDRTLWNWIEAIDPADATPEDVAVTIWGDSKYASRAYLLTQTGRYFRISPGWAHAMPHLEALAPRDGWYKPEDDNALAIAGSSIANEAAIESAAGLPHLKPQEAASEVRMAGYKKTLERGQRQLAGMKAKLPDGEQWGPLIPAITFIDKHLDNLTGFPAERLAKLQPVFDGQQEILFDAAGALDDLLGAGGIRFDPSTPIAAVVRDFVIAAGESHLIGTARAHLARAKAKQGTLAIDSADELLNDTRGGVKELDGAETVAFTYGGSQAKTDLAGYQKQLLGMRKTLAAGGTIADGDMELTTAKLRELQFLSKTRALYINIHNLAEEARDADNDGIEVIANLTNKDIHELPGYLYGIISELQTWVLNPYEQFMRDQVNMVWAETPGSPEDKKARARRIDEQLRKSMDAFKTNIAEKYDLQKVFSESMDEIKHAHLRTLIAQIILLIAVSVAGGVAGSIIGGAVRGVMLANTAVRTIGMLRAVNAARVLGTVAALTTDAAVNTVGQWAILGDDGDSFFYNLATNAVVLAALRPLHTVASAWKIPEAELKTLKLWEKTKVVGEIAFKKGVIVTAEMITAAGVSYAMERAVKGPPKDEATATQWIIQGASMAVGRFVSGQMSNIEQRLAKASMQGTAAWMRMRRVKATAVEVEKAGDAQRAFDIMIEHQKVLEEEHKQLEDLITNHAGKVPKEMLETLIRGNNAERKGVAMTAFSTMPLHLAGITPENSSGRLWRGTTDQIAIALHNAHGAGLEVHVTKHDTAAREWTILLDHQEYRILEEPLGARPREAREMTAAERDQARKYAEAAEYVQAQWEAAVKSDINGRAVVELDHLQVGYSIAGVMNQATMPSLGNDRGAMLVVYEHGGTMSNRGHQDIGQDPKKWDAPGIRTSEQAAPDARWAKSDDLDRALTVGRAELQTPAYRGRVTAIEKRPTTPGEDWKAPNRKLRVKVEADGVERWFYTDRFDNAGGMGPGLVAKEVTKAAGSMDQVRAMMETHQVVLGDDPDYVNKLKAGEILVWGGSPTGAWAAEPTVHSPKSHIDVVGDKRPKPGDLPTNWNDLIEAREAVVAKIVGGDTDPALIAQKDALEARLLAAHTGAAFPRNTKAGAAYHDPFKKGGQVRIEYGTPTKIEALPDGRILVEMGSGATLKSKIYDQIVLAHGQNPGAKGGPGELLGAPAAETAPGSRTYGEVPPGTIALKPVFSTEPPHDVIALESIDPPGIRLVGAAYAHKAMEPWIAASERPKFKAWLERSKSAGQPTRDHGAISEDSTTVTPGIEHQRDKLPQANEALSAKAFKLPGPKATVELTKGMTPAAQDEAVLRFLTIHMRADGEYVSIKRLGGGKSGALIYEVKVGDREVGVFKLFGNADDAKAELQILDMLAKSGLKKMKAVDARGMASVAADSGFGGAVLMDKAAGTSVRDLIKAAAPNAPNRAAVMKQLEAAMVSVAGGLAELHQKFGATKANNDTAMMSDAAKKSDAEYAYNKNFKPTGRDGKPNPRYQALQAEFGPKLGDVEAAVLAARQKFYDTPVPATAYLGDANAGNFMVSNYDPARGYQDLGLIDVGSMKWAFEGGNAQVGAKGKVTGAADIARFLGSLETMFPGNLQPHEVTALREKFMWAYTQGYRQGKYPEFLANIAVAEKWYRLELEFTVLTDPNSSHAAAKQRIMKMLGLML